MPLGWSLSVVCLFVLFAATAVTLLALIRQVGMLSLEARRTQLHSGSPAGLAVGSVAPVLNGRRVGSGTSLSTEQFRGSVLLLVFLSHECSACRAVVPHLNELVGDESLGFRTLVVIGADDEVARAFIDETGLQVPVLAGRTHFEAYRVTATPQCIIVDGEGVVTRGGSAQTRAEFIALVEGPPPATLRIDTREPVLAR
jgi:thiol-disulfide isomerase/thioredoxin